MRLLRRALLLLVLPLLLLPSGASAASLGQTQQRLRSLVGTGGGASGVYVREAETGTVLASRAPSVARVPASVTKLFTTSALLLAAGPDATLDTEVRIRGELTDGTLDGDVIVVAAGDPTFGSAQIRQLAAKIRARGIRRVGGRLLADLGRFGRAQGTDRTGGRYDRDIVGRLGGLVAQHGFATGGSDPAIQVLVRLRSELRRRGNTGAMPVGQGRRISSGSRRIGVVRSPSIARLAAATNVPSDNFNAEMLLRALGARDGGSGSTRNGTRRAAGVLVSELGVRMQQADGSGLSRANRVSPGMVVRLLDGMASRDDVGPALHASLAVAGRSGTLRYRMRGTAASGRCHAKTGTLRFVSALAGWCETRGGRTVSFAIIDNGVNTISARRRQDRILATIANWTTPALPVAATPAPDVPGEPAPGLSALPAA